MYAWVCIPMQARYTYPACMMNKAMLGFGWAYQYCQRFQPTKVQCSTTVGSTINIPILDLPTSSNVPAPIEFTRKQTYMVSFPVLGMCIFGIIMILFGIFSVLFSIFSVLFGVFSVLFGSFRSFSVLFSVYSYPSWEMGKTLERKSNFEEVCFKLGTEDW